MSGQVIAVVLAAGSSRRMGRPKQLLPWGDRTVLGQTLHNLQQSTVDEIVVVTGHEAQAVTAIAAQFDVSLIHNEAYDEGEMLSSLQKAVATVGERSDAVLVVLADQPMVSPQLIDRLLNAYADGWGDLLAPAYRGQRGNPVLIGRRYFQELLDLGRGKAPRHLLRRYQDKVRLVDVDSEAVLQDVDSPEDYERYRPGNQPSPF